MIASRHNRHVSYELRKDLQAPPCRQRKNQWKQKLRGRLTSVPAVFVRPIRSLIEDACAVELVKTLVPIAIPGRAAAIPFVVRAPIQVHKKNTMIPRRLRLTVRLQMEWLIQQMRRSHRTRPKVCGATVMTLCTCATMECGEQKTRMDRCVIPDFPFAATRFPGLRPLEIAPASAFVPVWLA